MCAIFYEFSLPSVTYLVILLYVETISIPLHVNLQVSNGF